MTKGGSHIILFILLAGMYACTSRKIFTSNYFTENEKALTEIETLYKKLSEQKPFAIGFTDRSFEYVSIEIITDSIKYINEFSITDQKMVDTLRKYALPEEGILELVLKMRAIHCIWVNTLDYYTNNQKRSLVFLSVKPVSVRLPFSAEKYLVLTFYQQPQYYDSDGNLLASRRLRKLRKINDETFRRLNDKVAYTVSEHFR